MVPNQPLTREDESLPLPFPGLTGQGVRVAVIDSGVNSRHPHIGQVAGGASVTPEGDIVPGDYTDILGHGTAVMAAIQEKAPAADFFAVKVFHGKLQTTAATLMLALRWCIDQKIDVVNLSLGTANPVHAEKFAQVVADAGKAGTLLVAAREADGRQCYPGSLGGVFSVGLDWDCPRNLFRPGDADDDPVFYASGYPRPAPGVPLRRNLHGISFAVANMTGFVVRACEAGGSECQNDRYRLIRETLAREMRFN